MLDTENVSTNRLLPIFLRGLGQSRDQGSLQENHANNCKIMEVSNPSIDDECKCQITTEHIYIFPNRLECLIPNTSMIIMGYSMQSLFLK